MLSFQKIKRRERCYIYEQKLFLFHCLSNNNKTSRRFLMERYEVGFNGHKIVFAKSFDDAKQSVEKDLKIIHPNLNVKFSYVSKLEEEE